MIVIIKSNYKKIKELQNIKDYLDNNYNELLKNLTNKNKIIYELKEILDNNDKKIYELKEILNNNDKKIYELKEILDNNDNKMI
jgi:hypothetical protein